MSFAMATRARIYTRESTVFEGRPAHPQIVLSFKAAGIEDVSVHHGIMGFDSASEMLSSRPLRFHPDLPLVIEAVGDEDQIQKVLARVKRMLPRGLITLTKVKMYLPEQGLNEHPA